MDVLVVGDDDDGVAHGDVVLHGVRDAHDDQEEVGGAEFESHHCYLDCVGVGVHDNAVDEVGGADSGVVGGDSLPLGLPDHHPRRHNAPRGDSCP